MPAHIDGALDALCEALLTLQAVRILTAGTATDPGSARGKVTQAIESLRRAISELRLARGEETCTLAYGFVRGAASGASEVEPRQSVQSNPRRTA